MHDRNVIIYYFKRLVCLMDVFGFVMLTISRNLGNPHTPEYSISRWIHRQNASMYSTLFQTERCELVMVPR